MALDRDYFNSIELELVNDKYYKVEQVDALLVDIRAKALEMNKQIQDAKTGSGKGEDYYVGKVAAMYSKLRSSQAKAIEDLNSQWQSFLAGLADDVPGDIGDKVSKIADNIKELDG